MQTRYHFAVTLPAIIIAISTPAAAQSEMARGADMLIKPGRWIMADAPTRSVQNGKALEPGELAEKSREQIVCLRAGRTHTIYDAVAFIVDPVTPQIKKSAFQNGTIETTINMGDAHINVTAQLSGTYDEAKFDIKVHASGYSRNEPIEAQGMFMGRYAGTCDSGDDIPAYDTKDIPPEM
jgi:hypothetical protein